MHHRHHRESIGFFQEADLDKPQSAFGLHATIESQRTFQPQHHHYRVSPEQLLIQERPDLAYPSHKCLQLSLHLEDFDRR